MGTRNAPPAAKKRSAPRRKGGAGKRDNSRFWLAFVLVSIAAIIGAFLIGLFVRAVHQALEAISAAYDRLSAHSPALEVLLPLLIGALAIGALLGVAWIAAYVVNRREAALRAAREAHLERIRTLDGLRALSPTEFEHAVGEMLTAQGYRKVQVHGGAGDLAADLTCVAPDGRSTVVQCKRYGPENTVGSPAIQQFIGMVKIHHKADQGIFVTTSGYTLPAMTLASDHAEYLRLIDGPECAEMMRQIK